MKGSWFYLNGERIANGLDNLKETLRGDATVVQGLSEKITEHVKSLAETPEAKV